MSTRRTYVYDDAAGSPSDAQPGRILDPAKPPASSNTSPAVPTSVVVKLLLFTLLMVAAPISTYFLTVDALFSGNATYAGAAAAGVANVVLVAYIVAAVLEDQGEPAGSGVGAAASGAGAGKDKGAGAGAGKKAQ